MCLPAQANELFAPFEKASKAKFVLTGVALFMSDQVMQFP